MGPLAGLRVIEMAGLGPAPFAGMMLADMGAEVVRIDRIRNLVTGEGGKVVESARDEDELVNRSKRSVAMNLKDPGAVAALLTMVETADAVIEGYRPGVMERLGLGPDVLLARNPRLVLGRMTGWGQQGPLSLTAGHDINYISIAGVLAHIGRADGPPVPPVNLGDYGGGSMFLAFGVVCALLEAGRSGQGQVVDASILDGAAALMTGFWAMSNSGLFDQSRRGSNMLDSGCYFYDVYECADGEYVSIAAAEPQFYAAFLDRAGLAGDPAYAQTLDRTRWPRMRERFRELFLSRTQAQWLEVFGTSDACIAPVLRMADAARHPHNVERSTFVEVNGAVQPAPAPRFSRTANAVPSAPVGPGHDTTDVLSDWGFSPAAITTLLDAGTVGQG